MSLLYWVLFTLVAISLTGNHPVWALVTGGSGGIALGLHSWHALRRTPLPSGESGQSALPLAGLYRYQLLLGLPGILVLAFPNRLPLWLAVSGLAWLVVLGVWRFTVDGRPARRTPLDLPVGLLVVLMSSLGMWAAPDRVLTIHGVLTLLAGAGLFYALVNELQTPRRLQAAAWALVAAGATAACVGVLSLDPGEVNLSMVRLILRQLPRAGLHANPNYVGGALGLFLPLAVWGALLDRSRARLGYLSAALILGVSLGLTLSRGAFMGVAVALAVTAAWTSRWIRVALLLLVLVAGGVLYTRGLSQPATRHLRDGAQSACMGKQRHFRLL